MSRVFLNLSLLILVFCFVAVRSFEDEDFSEFDNPDDDDQMAATNEQMKNNNNKKPTTPDRKQQQQQQQQQQNIRFNAEDEEAAMVRDAEDDDAPDAEFDHFQDSEEFEGHDTLMMGSSGGENRPNSPARPADSSDQAKRDLKINAVPLHLSTSWQGYYLEIMSVVALSVYFLNFLNGRSKNARLASAWLDANRSVLESNFALVGDDGTGLIQDKTSAEFRKEAENQFSIYCSGRVFVESLTAELKLIKRQCLIGVLGHMMRPTSDQITFKIAFESLESLVFCFVAKKSAQKLTKELSDVSLFCERKSLPEKAAREFGDHFSTLSELSEVTQTIFQDVRVTSLVGQFKDVIEMIYISDQYQSEKLTMEQQEGVTKKPDTEKVLIMKINLPGKGRTSEDQMEPLVDLLKLCLYLADKVSRMRLSKESKSKAEKNRQKLEETFLKQTHAQRQENAQQRKEERIRQEREKIMAEDDPDKQRRLELKENKRLAKKSGPKLRQMKVRAM